MSETRTAPYMDDLYEEFKTKQQSQGERPSWDMVKWAFTMGGVARIRIQEERAAEQRNSFNAEVKRHLEEDHINGCEDCSALFEEADRLLGG